MIRRRSGATSTKVKGHPFEVVTETDGMDTVCRLTISRAAVGRPPVCKNRFYGDQRSAAQLGAGAGLLNQDLAVVIERCETITLSPRKAGLAKGKYGAEGR